MSPQVAPYGTWKSNITSDVLIQGAQTNEVAVDAVTGRVYAVESRPSEAGRCVVVAYSNGTKRDVFGKDWSARSGVHEYGGAAVAIRDNICYFSDNSTRRLHRVLLGRDESPVPVTPDDSTKRYGDFQVHPKQGHLLASILEDHTKPAPEDVVNTLVLVDSERSSLHTLRSGADFYSTPQWTPNGQKLAWIEWYHPDMPWEGTQLYIASFSQDTLSLTDVVQVAGERGTVSVQQPSWLSDDKLLFISDKSGFYAPYLYDRTTLTTKALVPGGDELATSDFAEPQWKLGSTTYAVLDANRIVFSRTHQGFAQLYLYTVDSRSWTRLQNDYVDVEAVRRLDAHSVVFRGWKVDSGLALVKASLRNNDTALVTDEIQPPASSIEPGHLSRPQGLTLKTDAGDPLHVIYQPPANKDYSAPEGELPPCIVQVHGGPTGVRVSAAFSWLSQYFTNRGWAWLVVNYGGSSGYGRAYRDRLNGEWGVVDINDCVEAVKQLSKSGLVDGKRLAIRGSSAGGYTVLQAVVTHPDLFAAATSAYGISDLAAIVADTHKFESHSGDKLLGGTIEEKPQVYKDRSPVYHADKIKTPLLILQGLDDAVVPPSQAKFIVDAIHKRNGTVKYIAFEGEGHGWRRAENIKRALEEELAFYEETFHLRS
ncbi:alpha/beta-hydrolase [Auricularia subglabra TFB-10046 SS5]|nr:alpha/beta-hydrolase [Auricularia subglabra TFB-10046 SS5]